MEKFLKNYQIVGMGEATHGQEKITKFRINMFKKLVKNHHFTSFVLEDSYAVCTVINSYIQNKIAININNICLMQPFNNKHIFNLIKWMKSYNKIHNNKLEFIGVDLQYYNEDVNNKVDKYAYELFKNAKYTRDQKMFKLFLKLFNSKKKYFIYAHMGHLQIKDAVFGYYLKKHFKNKFCSVGNAFYTGEYAGMTTKNKYATIKINHHILIKNGFYTYWNDTDYCYIGGLIINPKNEKWGLFKYEINGFFDAIVVINNETPLQFKNCF